MSTFTKQKIIRFAHCDTAGIVFYPRYFEMLNDLIEDWFAEGLDFPFHKMHSNNGVPTVNIKVNFNSPGKLGDEITKVLWVTKMGNSSLNYHFKFLKDDTVLIDGEATLVYVVKDGHNGIKAEKWPEEVAANIRRYFVD